jgi:hypothetical protein
MKVLGRSVRTTFTKRIWIEHADAESISVDEEITLMDWGKCHSKENREGARWDHHTVDWGFAP